ncbi:hypothetical protein GCM10025857_10520 [Alicyclobacillus contaminans]|uniref:DUF6282 family protein n=1 Tax=Alicyclobacillus contaminans TaxID=392016 RepID=UPI0004057C08|nr:DUF6282 family protein [Alicyclobacillus contaminans]GMA49695.1 hypothetical protein GCM10025857_10520 [Alicyclobacillus contaminans]
MSYVPMTDKDREQVRDLLRGAYDTHVHVDPDLIERRTDDLNLAKAFLDNGLKGFVLKSHYFATVERAKVVANAVPGIHAFGAVTLNHAVGGFNPVLVDVAGRAGARIIWFPTVDAANETAGREDGPVTNKLPFWAKIQREIHARGIAPAPLSVVDDEGKVRPDVQTCLELIKEYDMTLATGHLGKAEIFALVEAANQIGVKRVVVTHALFPAEQFTVDEQVRLSQMGALIEHCYTTFYTNKCSWETLFASVKAVGPDKCVLSSDLGQKVNPSITEGFFDFAHQFLAAGFSPADVRRMAVDNTTLLVEPDYVFN